MTTFDELIRYRERQRYGHNRFNIIGFSHSEAAKYKHCIFCTGTRLQPDPHDDTKLMCFSCGYSVLAQDASSGEGISVMHGKQKSAIITAKSRKKYYDDQGNEITDPDLIQEIHRGAHVIAYREVKSEVIKDTNRVM